MDACATARKLFTEEPGLSCIPADEIFSGADGTFTEAATSKNFIGANLCDEYEIQRYIESGSFGRGWVAIDKKAPRDSNKVFLKTFRCAADQANDRKVHEFMIRKEIDVLLQADAHRIPDHPNLVNGVRVCYGPVTVPRTGASGKMFFLVSPDLCEGGELYNYLVFGAGVQKLEEHIARFYFKQLAEGVAHMHKHGLFHRDLKLENVVLDSHYRPKIMDFGHAKHARECRQQLDPADGQMKLLTPTYVGTSTYQPPELSRDSTMYDPAAFDMWSLGVIFFFIVGIEGLAAIGNDFTFMAKVRRRDPGYSLLDQHRTDGRVPDNAAFWKKFGATLKFTKELKHLLNGLLDLNPTMRFKAADVLAHPWMQAPMPTQEEIVAVMSRRSSGIVGKELTFSLASVAPTRDAALERVEAAVKQIAPYSKSGYKIGVVRPPQFLITISEDRTVFVSWLTGGLDEWLEFRHLLCHTVGVQE